MSDASAVRAGRAYVELYTTNNKLSAGLDAAGREVRKWGADIMKVGAGVFAAGSSISAAMVLMARSAANSNAELAIAAQRASTTISGLSALKYAAEQCGIDFDKLTTRVGYMNRFLGDVERGGHKDAMKSMGMSVADLAGKTGDERFRLFAEKLKAIKDPALQTSLAIAVFGRGAIDILPLLRMGAEGIDQFTARAKAMGIVVGKEEAEAGLKFKQTMNDVDGVLARLKTVIGNAVMPQLQDFMDQVIRLTAGGIKWVQTHKDVVAKVFEVAAAVSVAGAAVIGFGAAIYGAGAMIRSISAIVGALVGSFNLLLSPVRLIGSALLWVGSVAVSVLSRVGSAIASAGSLIWSIFGSIAQSILTGVVSLGVAIAVAFGQAFISVMTTGLLTMARLMPDLAITIFSPFATIAREFADTAIRALALIPTVLMKSFGGVFFSITSAVVESIAAIVPAVVAAVSGVIASLSAILPVIAVLGVATMGYAVLTSGVFTAVATMIGTACVGAVVALGTAFSALAGFIGTVVTAAVAGATAAFEKLIGYVGDVGKWLGQLPSFFAGFVSGFAAYLDIAVGSWEGFTATMKFLWLETCNGLKLAWMEIKGFLVNTWADLKVGFEDMLHGWQGGIKAIAGVFIDLQEELAKGVPTLAEAIKNAMTKALDVVVDPISKRMAELFPFAASVVQLVRGDVNEDSVRGEASKTADEMFFASKGNKPRAANAALLATQADLRTQGKGVTGTEAQAMLPGTVARYKERFLAGGMSADESHKIEDEIVNQWKDAVAAAPTGPTAAQELAQKLKELEAQRKAINDAINSNTAGSTPAEIKANTERKAANDAEIEALKNKMMTDAAAFKNGVSDMPRATEEAQQEHWNREGDLYLALKELKDDANAKAEDIKAAEDALAAEKNMTPMQQLVRHFQDMAAKALGLPEIPGLPKLPGMPIGQDIEKLKTSISGSVNPWAAGGFGSDAKEINKNTKASEKHLAKIAAALDTNTLCLA